jgi:hypothetical protein
LDPSLNHAFVGQCHYYGCPGKLALAALGYSGVVAEVLDQDFDADAESIRFYLGHEFILSPTDQALTETLHPSWQLRAIERSLDLLRENWKNVLGAAWDVAHYGNIYLHRDSINGPWRHYLEERGHDDFSASRVLE